MWVWVAFAWRPAIILKIRNLCSTWTQWVRYQHYTQTRKAPPRFTPSLCLRISIDPVQQPNNLHRLIIVKHPKQPLVIQVGEGWFKLQRLIDRAVPVEMLYNGVDEFHLIGRQITRLDKF